MNKDFEIRNRYEKSYHHSNWSICYPFPSRTLRSGNKIIFRISKIKHKSTTSSIVTLNNLVTLKQQTTTAKQTLD